MFHQSVHFVVNNVRCNHIVHSDLARDDETFDRAEMEATGKVCGHSVTPYPQDLETRRIKGDLADSFNLFSTDLADTLNTRSLFYTFR